MYMNQIAEKLAKYGIVSQDKTNAKRNVQRLIVDGKLKLNAINPEEQIKWNKELKSKNRERRKDGKSNKGGRDTAFYYDVFPEEVEKYVESKIPVYKEIRNAYKMCLSLSEAAEEATQSVNTNSAALIHESYHEKLSVILNQLEKCIILSEKKQGEDEK